MLGKEAFLINLYVLNFWSGTEPSLPLFNMMFNDPNKVYNLANSIAMKYRKDTLRVFPSCVLLAKLSGSNIRAGLLSDIYKETVAEITGDNPLGKFIFDRERKLSKGLRDSLQMIPNYVPTKINRLTTALLKVYLSVNMKVPRRLNAYIWDSLSLKDKEEFERSFLGKTDKERIAYAFQVMCVLLDSLRSVVNRYGSSMKSFYLRTPYGYISFGSKDKDSFPNSIIVIDPGGDDIYGDVRLGLDLSGNDIYKGDVGFGFFGIGGFVDEEGNDVYKGSYIGAGFLGFGLLYDLRGNDIYKCKVFCLGAGYMGGGMVVDKEGNDTYYAISKSQGFGWVGGVGILVDVEGNDNYELEDSVLYFPSPQSPKHNTSLGQGMGYGERRDFYNGRSLGGGLGILVDVKGDDRYYSSVFSQGSGYWLGVGVLYDGDGNDAYSGVWYSQGAAAHFGIGALYDLRGNDVYLSLLSTSQGVGHDFSYGILIDFNGKDTYTCGNLCLGSGNAQGVGIFWDFGGEMRTNLKGKGLGVENPAVDKTSFRYSFPTKGFVCKGKACP